MLDDDGYGTLQPVLCWSPQPPSLLMKQAISPEPRPELANPPSEQDLPVCEKERSQFRAVVSSAGQLGNFLSSMDKRSWGRRAWREIWPHVSVVLEVGSCRIGHGRELGVLMRWAPTPCRRAHRRTLDARLCSSFVHSCAEIDVLRGSSMDRSNNSCAERCFFAEPAHANAEEYTHPVLCIPR